MCVNFSIDPFWRISLLYDLVFHTRTTKVVQQLINLDLCIYWVTYYFIKHKEENSTSEFPSDFFS